jgi:imidazolonepropionase-like amidohydrolase
MRRLLLCTSLALGLVATAGAVALQPPNTVAFTSVTVVPMDTNRTLANHTVIVTGDRITAMGPSQATRVPAGATSIDGRGKFLMPGLAEMHGHVPPPTAAKELTESVLFLYVAAGVTTVRGMQGAPGQLELKARTQSGDLVGPNLYLAGPAFSGGSVKTPEEAVARVRQQKAEGWDLLKVLTGLSVDTYDAMARTAKEVGIRFGGHVPTAVGLLHALDMGQETFDHLDGFAEQLDGLTKPVDPKALQELVGRTKKAGAWVVPTMVVWETLRGPVTLESRTGLPELKYLPRQQVTQWTGALEKRLKSAEFNAAEAKVYIDNRMQILRALHAGGVGVLLGSDAPQQFNVPGYSIHREMQRMADSGMSPFDIIRSGTANVGEYFKSQDSFGTIASGKRADLILVDADPLRDVRNIARQSGVMVKGRWLPQPDIDRRLAQIAAANASATESR